MWIFGLILLAVSVGLAFGHRQSKSNSAVYAATETSTAEFLESIAEELDGSPLSYFAEMKGVVECEQPLQSELEEMDCVYYRMSVRREYEETYYDTDSDGRRRRRTRKGSDMVSQNERSVPFYLKDSSGRMRIRPDGAEFQAEKVVSRFEPESVAANNFQLGKFKFRVPERRLSGDRRTLGYRFEEFAIPLNQELYVLGEVVGMPGNLMLQKPGDQQRFLLSTKSEAQLQSESDDAAKGLLIGSIVVGIIGLILVVVGLL